jgi:hypothetical protein
MRRVLYACFVFALGTFSVACSESEPATVDASGGRTTTPCVGRACDAGSGGADGAPMGEADVFVGDPLCPITNQHVTAPTGPVRDGVEIVERTASVNDGPTALAANGTYVVWANDTTFHRISIADSRIDSLLDRTRTSNRVFQGIAVDDANLYIDDSGTRAMPLGISKLPLDGSAAPINVIPYVSSYLLTLANGYFYFADSNENTIVRATIDGGTPMVILRNVNPTGLTVGGGYVYFIHPRANSSDIHLLRVRADASAPSLDAGAGGSGSIPEGAEDLAKVSNAGTAPAVADDNYVYWGDGDKVFKLPHTGGAPVVLAQATTSPGGPLPMSPSVGSVTTAGDAVYWVQSSAACPDIMKASPDGGAPTKVAANVVDPRSLVVGMSYLYFIADGHLMRVRR